MKRRVSKCSSCQGPEQSNSNGYGSSLALGQTGLDGQSSLAFGQTCLDAAKKEQNSQFSDYFFLHHILVTLDTYL